VKEKKKERHKRDGQQRELDVALRAMDDAEGEGGRCQGPHARRLAERAVCRGVEHFMVAQRDHELGKVPEATFESLARLDVETDREFSEWRELTRSSLRGAHAPHGQGYAVAPGALLCVKKMPGADPGAEQHEPGTRFRLFVSAV
jgi:hypothetical protein